LFHDARWNSRNAVPCIASSVRRKKQPCYGDSERQASQDEKEPEEVTRALVNQADDRPGKGTKASQHHLHENLGALHVDLSADDLREIDAALIGVTVHGGRMNADNTPRNKPRAGRRGVCFYVNGCAGTG
jgi:hypothetical protein